MTHRIVGFVPPGVVLVFTATFLMLTFQIPVASRTAPLIVAWVTLVLAMLDALTRLRTPVGQALMRMFNPAGLLEEDKLGEPAELRHTLTSMGLMVILAAAIVLVGVLPASAIFITATFIIAGSSRWLAVAVATVFTLLLWLTFGGLLRLNLFPGLLFGGVF